MLLKAQVVACTLSASGGELKALLPQNARFSALIIDEARVTPCRAASLHPPHEPLPGPFTLMQTREKVVVKSLALLDMSNLW